MARSTEPSSIPPRISRRSEPVTRFVEELDPQGAVAEQVGRIGHGDPVEQAPDTGGVLLCEHLGRRHQRPLMPTLHRGQQRRHGDHGLAGTDVALQQAVHRVRAGEIGLDLVDRASLRRRQRERQQLVEAADELALRLMADAARRPLVGPLAHHEHDLDAQELVEREPPASGLLLGHRLRQVDAEERLLPADQAVPTTHVLGKRIEHAANAAPLERVLDPVGDLPRGELRLLALRIDRHDAAGAIADEIDDRVGHLQSAAIGLGPAEQRHRHVRLELPLAPRLVEEHDRESTRNRHRRPRSPLPADSGSSAS